MADRSERQQQRCPNPKCGPSPGKGRVLFEHANGMVYVEHQIGGRSGRFELAVMGMPITVTCPSCGHHWLNPDLVAFDGMAGVVQRTMDAVADRAREELAESAERKPRDRLQRRPAA